MLLLSEYFTREGLCVWSRADDMNIAYTCTRLLPRSPMRLASATEEVWYIPRPFPQYIERHCSPRSLTDDGHYLLISAEATGIARATFLTDEEGYVEHAKLPTSRNVTGTPSKCGRRMLDGPHCAARTPIRERKNRSRIGYGLFMVPKAFSEIFLRMRTCGVECRWSSMPFGLYRAEFVLLGWSN